LLSIVAYKTLTFYKVAYKRHALGVVGSLVTGLLQMFSWFRHWNRFEIRPIFDEVKAYEVKTYKKMCQFLATMYMMHNAPPAILLPFFALFVCLWCLFCA